ncbi:MAG: RHS repeat protein, partial [Firmicutes bacterium]|nr:RHS repeat protein [Bacillota bacterium]
MFTNLMKKTISIMLVIAMLLEVGTPLCYAAGLEGEGQTGQEEQGYEDLFDGSAAVFDADKTELLNSTNNRYEALKASNYTVVSESEKRRDEYAKGYRLKDGSEAVFLYPFAVNEKDGSGSWAEIDNTLSLGKDTQGRDIYTAESHTKDAAFYAEPVPGMILELSTASGRIVWGLKDTTQGVYAEFSEPKTEEGYSVLQPKSVGSILTYEEVLPGTDLRLQLVGNDAEENVILKSPAASQAASQGLSYMLSLEGYSAELAEEGILLIPEGSEEVEYVITASYMEDAEGAWSKDIQIELSEEAEGYAVTVYPSSEWLLSPERTYPIVIDPTIAQRTSTSILRATTVTSVSTYDPQYICGTQHVGKDGAYYGKMRVALQFDLPTQVTEADMVIDAGIIVKQRGYSGASGGTVTVNAHRMTTTAVINWNFKWATLNGHYEDTVLDSQTMSSATSGSWVTWDITKAVKDWYINGDNHGIALVSENEETAYKYIGFISPYDTGVSSSNYPIISVTYLNREGLESYLSCHSAGSGSMGTVSVSDFTGDLVYIFDDLSLSGEYLPLSIQHVYDHSRRTNADVVNSSMHFGAGFRLNVTQKITAITDTGLRAAGYWYTLTDADGTVHYFKLKSGTGGANGSTYEKEFETATILTKSSSGYTIDYNSDLVYTFGTGGHLTKIQDSSNGKSMTLTYSSSRLTKVKDGAGREATLTYDTDGYLTKITDPAGREITYTYSSGRLTRITSPDGKYVQFTYAAGGDGTQMMTAVADIDGSKLEIAYNTNAPCRVKSILEKGTSSGEGGKLTWTYGAGETTITDRKGNTETMMFDDSGHTVCVKDSAGNAFFGSYDDTDDN